MNVSRTSWVVGTTKLDISALLCSGAVKGQGAVAAPAAGEC